MTRMSLVRIAAVILIGTPATGQSPEQAEPPPGASEQAPAPPPTAESANPDVPTTLRPGRQALLREGTLLVDVKGWMRFDEKTKSWRYVIDVDDETVPGYELTLLPNSILEEMIELHRIARGQSAAFEVSGRVFVYQGASYFLASHAPQLIEHHESREHEASPSAEPKTPAILPDDDSVESIMLNLRQSAGKIARSRSGSERTRTGSSGLLAEGTMLVSRRGRLARTASGSWTFVFDSDASGLSDPPLTIIPCLLLERMEQYAHRQSGLPPLVISGQVLRFYDHNFLAPTVFQIPRERTHMTP